jgi:hypothetical protein
MKHGLNTDSSRQFIAALRQPESRVEIKNGLILGLCTSHKIN